VSAVARGSEHERIRVELPGGVWRKRARVPVREVVLRPVGPEDEVFLLDTADETLPSRRASGLLARCIAEPAPGYELAAELSVGDREALLLHLRRLTIGETFDCVVRCPGAGCDEVLELELAVDDLLVQPYADVRRQYELDVGEGEERYEIAFRVPRARDLDGAAELAADAPERAVQALLRSCVLCAVRGGVPVAVGELPDDVRHAIAEAMSEHDPQAELELDLACPACGASFSVVFDAASFFLQELDGRAAQLLSDVHALALHYHWSEDEILRLTPARRARYLELIGGGSGG
jgi:hypothetical protein